MKKKNYKGIPYSLWNPFTPMDQWLNYLGVGPIVITRGEGAHVYDDKDRKYINGFSSLWNVSVGHGRKELIEAATKQIPLFLSLFSFSETAEKILEQLF